MENLLSTNNLAVISYIEALLSEADIDYMVLDQYTSSIEGSIGAIPRRVLVRKNQIIPARRILREADLGEELGVSTL